MKLKSKPLFRTLPIEAGSFRRDEQGVSRVALSFSSEAEVERWFGVEILDHDPKSCRMDRLLSGGPLLINHNPDDQVGVLESAKIGADRRGRAEARFGRSGRAKEIAQDVEDGIRVNTSVAYRVHEMVLESKRGDKEVYRVVDWEPLEVSIVAVGADPSVGVGRSAELAAETEIMVRRGDDSNEREEIPMNKCPKCQTILAADGTCPVCQAKDSARQEETFRIRELASIGEVFKMPDLAREHIDKGTSIEEFRKLVMDALAAQANKPKQTVTKEGSNIQITRDEGDKPFRSFGEQLLAVARAYSPGGHVDPRLAALNAQYSRAAMGLNTQIGSDGGFLVQTEFSLALMEKAQEAAVLMPKCWHVPIGADADSVEMPYIEETSRQTGSRWGGVQVFRRHEADDVQAKRPKFGLLECKLEDLMGLCYITNRTLKDASATEAIVSKAFGSEFSFKGDDEVLRGTGAGEMLGILNSTALIIVPKEQGQQAATIVYENIVKMWARCLARCRARAVWLYNQEIEPQLFTLGITLGTGGQAVYLPPGGLSASPYATLLGRPMIPIEQASALGALGDLMLVDFNEYMIIEKGGLDAQSSIHVRFIYDEMTFKFIVRNNGMPLWKKPLTPYKGSNSLSPFVALAERA
jgi:HK97 family phage major capsid protein